MDRMSFFNFKGYDYPTMASARAIKAYCNHCGLELNQAFEGFDGSDVEVTLYLLSELLKAGYTWTERNGGASVPPPSFDDLMDELLMQDMPRATICVIETMTKSLYQNVNAKNAEPLPDQPENK